MTTIIVSREVFDALSTHSVSGAFEPEYWRALPDGRIKLVGIGEEVLAALGKLGAATPELALRQLLGLKPN